MADDNLVNHDGKRLIKDRIGEYKLICGDRKRVLGTDWCIWAVAVAGVVFPTLDFLIFVVPSYDSIALIIILELVFITIAAIDLFIFYDLLTTEPGIIPKTSLRVNKMQDYFVKLKDVDEHGNFDPNAKLKYCKTCKIIRPPRSFHCHKCDVCIEVHDHHCPWIGGCVGLRNHKKFVIFLLYTSFLGLCGLILTLPPLIMSDYPPYGGSDTGYLINDLALCIYSGLFFVVLLPFGLSHLFLASKNKTTNESLRRKYKRVQNPFDRGTSDNISKFWTEYPNSKSNIFDLKQQLLDDEEKFYQDVLAKYGELNVKQLDKPADNKSFSFSGSDHGDDEEENNDPHRSALQAENSDGVIKIYL